MKNILWLFSILLLFVSSATSQTQSVPANIARLRRQAQMTYGHTQILHDEEYAPPVPSNGSVDYPMVSERGGKFTLPLGTMLLLRTHTYGAQGEPSDADKATAKKMSARNCVATVEDVPGVLLANKASAQTAGVELQVYDYAALPPLTLQKFVRGTQEILSGTGISIHVVLCERTTADSCESPNDRVNLVLRVVRGSAKTMNHAVYSPLGQSFADHSGGRYASVFLESVQDQASEANIPWLTVLDYAAVHEIGHLLLGDRVHMPRGMMKARWDLNDYVDMSQGRLHFSDEQIRQLRNRYASNTQVEETLIEARH